MPVKMIIATGINDEIGKDNDLLWDIPEDMQYFRETTSGSAVLMGRKTHDSIGRLLPNRTNYILSRTEGDNMVSKCQADELCKQYNNSDATLWIIGGEQVYEMFKHEVRQLHWTLVDESYPDADAHMDMSFVSEEFYRLYGLELCDLASVGVYERF